MLFKTTLVIWSRFDPEGMEMEDLAFSVSQDESYCSGCATEEIENPRKDIDFDGNSFFRPEDSTNEEESVQHTD